MADPAPVSLCLIVKNEKNLRQNLSAVRPYVAEVCVVDTGSGLEALADLDALGREGLISKLEVATADVYAYHGVPIDFAKARNASFALATQPWVLWMDGDDEIHGIGALSAEIASLTALRSSYPGHELQVYYDYEYEYDELGRCNLQVTRERLMSNPKAWRWLYPIHECCTGTGPTVRWDRHSAMIWKHRRSAAGKSGGEATKRNWLLLEKYWEKEGDAEAPDHRMALYTAMTLRDLGGRQEESLTWYRKALAVVPTDNDLAIACYRCATLLFEMGRAEEALPLASLLAMKQPSWAQGNLLLARAFYAIAHKEGYHDSRTLERLLHFGNLGLSQQMGNWFGEPVDRLQAFIGMTIALDWLGRHAEGYALAERGLAEYPTDPWLLGNRDVHYAVMSEGQILQVAGKLAELRKSKAGSAVAGIVDRTAAKLREFVEGGGFASNVAPAPPALPALREDGKLRIFIACGPVWETWNPEILEGKGFGGGSEQAVVDLSRMLAALGHEVTVSTNCGEAGFYDGVRWLPWEKAGEAGVVDVLIAWRQVPLVEMMAARLRILWMHDVVSQGATEKHLRAADLVVVSSVYHREVAGRNHPEIAPEKFKVLRWGASAARFDGAVRRTSGRNPYKMISTSSPDRGLKHLVPMWNRIRGAVPDAELHVFYGFEMWEKMAAAFGDKARLAECLELKADLEKLEGVFLRGRVSPDELALEYASAGVWVYPCDWPEIFCVSAVEAQMAGCRAVTTRAGALPEVVRGWVTVDLGPDFESGLLLALQSEGIPDEEVAEAFAYRAEFDLEPIGKMWEDMMRSALAGKIDLPAFEGVL